jgi:hypothetical protein
VAPLCNKSDRLGWQDHATLPSMKRQPYDSKLRKSGVTPKLTASRFARNCLSARDFWPRTTTQPPMDERFARYRT